MTTLQFADEQEYRASIREVRQDSSPVDWVLFGYENDKAQKLVSLGKGSGGINELATHLKDDIIAYGLVRKTDQIDDSTTVKFAFINFLGDNVPRMLKARVSVQQGAIKDFIGQYHVDINTSSRDEVTDAVLQEKIGLTSGSGSRVVNRDTGAREGANKGGRSTAAVNVKGATDLNFGDADALKSAIADVRSDSTPTDWTLFTYADETSNTIIQKSSGSDGVSGLLSNLSDDMVAYGLVRKIEKIDDSETVKFAYIRFVGEQIPRMLRARLGTHSGAVNAFFHPYHVTIEATEKSEISDDIIYKSIKAAAGTAVHVLPDQARPNVTQQWQPRNTGGTNTTNATTKAPVPKASLAGDQGLKYADESAIRNAIKEVRADDNPTDWALVGYEGDKGSTLVLNGKGSGGLEELRSHLRENAVGYGLLRTTDKIDNSVTVKFVFINWVGEKIDRMHRARLGTHKGQVHDLFAPFHVDINAAVESEVTADIVREKVQDASGSGSKVKH
ncbi:hypothetical protein PROFUN_11132 [Planoprotostelium fungivorum]|uniref:Coactosin n=1 Tax=Planoprotostelium fungivorum TaxID=1890364 RepID=A0A2P6NAS2_9EUKA|nr:hypothetical protein PROFUN_11132 [Planoprotostelium fungivorum]